MSDARAIAAAAREVLVPLGLRQRGHSGVFIADHGFWIAIAEFDEDRAHLTVGAHWLWYVQSRRCFDYGRRLDFAAQRPREMALRAADAVTAIEAQFRSVAAIARHLAAPAEEFWPLYHAGVASALAGEADAARGFFARLAAKRAQRGWETEVQAAAGALAEFIADLDAFRARVGAIVERTRALQGLPALPVRLA